jgi:uncharacterized protein YcgI (DUF1989 family)
MSARTTAAVELYATQLGLLDEVVEAGTHGRDRDEALRAVALEHVSQRLNGEGAYVGGAVREDVLDSPRPQYGAARERTVLEPVTGTAIPLRRGEVLRIEQVEGGTCVDFNAFNLNDYKEQLSCGFTRGAQSFDPRGGSLIWSNAPRGRPMFGILEMADSCDLDIVGHRCNRVFNELWWGERVPDHPNCQDTLAEAIREYGLTPDEVHDSFNLWMSTTIDETGRRRVRWNPAMKGDSVELLALFDVLAVVCICGVGDLLGINNYTFEPILVDVCEKTEDTGLLADRIEERWGRLDAQVTPDELASVPIRSSRALAADPEYAPSYLPLPPTSTLEVELAPEELSVIEGLMATGLYGRSPGEALRASFMRWCNANHTLSRRPKLRLG